MTPHKDPAKLPVDDQLKLLRGQVGDMQLDVSATHIKIRVIQDDVRVLKDDVRVLKTDVKDIKSDVKTLSKKFDKLYNMVVGFVGRIKRQDLEIGANTNRISRLERIVYTTSV